MQTINIMIVGVGGQGTLLTSRVLGKIALTGGYDVKLSEVHGMAQRGGSVVTDRRRRTGRYSDCFRTPGGAAVCTLPETDRGNHCE